jgi:heavy metal-binding protein
MGSRMSQAGGGRGPGAGAGGATRRLVLAIRVLVLAAAAAAVAASALLSRSGAPGVAGPGWGCPMHPEVRAAAPGACPICGMALVPTGPPRGEAAAARTGAAASAPSRAAASAPSGEPGGGRAPLSAAYVSAEAANLVRYSMGLARRRVLPAEVFAPARVAGDGLVMAQLYQDELAALAPDERALFLPAAAPGTEIPVRRAEAPPLAWDRSVWQVGFRLEPAAGARASAGAAGWVKLSHRRREMLVVPQSAVLQSPDGPYVLVYSLDRRTITTRPVATGKVFLGVTAVASGLREREVVVVMNTFFFDAERRLRNDANAAAAAELPVSDPVAPLPAEANP